MDLLLSSRLNFSITSGKLKPTIVMVAAVLGYVLDKGWVELLREAQKIQKLLPSLWLKAGEPQNTENFQRSGLMNCESCSSKRFSKP